MQDARLPKGLPCHVSHLGPIPLPLATRALPRSTVNAGQRKLEHQLLLHGVLLSLSSISLDVGSDRDVQNKSTNCAKFVRVARVPNQDVDQDDGSLFLNKRRVAMVSQIIAVSQLPTSDDAVLPERQAR